MNECHRPGTSGRPEATVLTESPTEPPPPARAGVAPGGRPLNPRRPGQPQPARREQAAKILRGNATGSGGMRSAWEALLLLDSEKLSGRSGHGQNQLHLDRLIAVWS